MKSSGPFRKNDCLIKLLGILLRNDQKILTYIKVCLVCSLNPNTNYYRCIIYFYWSPKCGLLYCFLQMILKVGGESVLDLMKRESKKERGREKQDITKCQNII